MKDLIAFLTARLDEDEHIARMAAEDASASANWHVDARYEHSGHAGVSGENGEVVVFDEGSPAQMEAEHIARHDPARTLREVAAKRRMLTEVKNLIDSMDAQIESEWGSGYGATGESDLLLKLLALPYGDHPDYHAEWKP